MNKSYARQILSEGNGKLSKDILVWNLPAGDAAMGGTCNMVCGGCYAIKAQKQYTNTVPQSRKRKYDLSLTYDFMQTIINAITTLNKPYVRIHESGDFYSQEYINKWMFIAQSLPHVQFVAYTKQMRRFDFSMIKQLKNVTIIDSLHGGRMNYGQVEDKPKNMVLCPCNVVKTVKGCGHDCDLCYDPSNKVSLESNGIFFKAH